MIKQLLNLTVLLLVITKINAQSALPAFPVDTLLISAQGIQERLALFGHTQATLSPLLQKKSTILSANFPKNNRLVYQCTTTNRMDIFEISITILTPLQNVKISGASINTRIWQPIKNHYLIVAIQAKGRQQKKLEKEIVKRIKKMIDSLNL